MAKKSSSRSISGSFEGVLAMWEVGNLSLAVALSAVIGSSVPP